jgi:hypothetical protein
MLKKEMRDTLNTALDLLDEAAATARPTKATREKLAAFAQDTRETLARGLVSGGEPSRILWRLAELTNPRTGRDILIEVNKNGSLVPSDRERVGGKLQYAPEWTEVRATSRTEARQLVAEGEGTRYRRTKGRVVEVQAKAAASKGA